MERPNPKMLTLARESRGLTQSVFAPKVKLAQTTVSRYEAGLLDIADEHLDRIAEALHYRKGFFFLPGTLYGFGSGCDLYHRKRQSLSMRALRAINAQVNILGIQMMEILRRAPISLEKQLVRLDVDRYGTPERLASLVRSWLHLPQGPLDNVVGAIEQAGGIVFSWPFGSRKIDAVSHWPPGGPPFFFINSEAPGDRVRLTLAHELGHIVMHESPCEGMERQADRFAVEFLMPQVDICHELASMSIQRAATLKPRWRVSMAALIRRARDLGQLTDWQYKNLFMQLGKLGYRTNEPIPIPLETPSKVSNIIDDCDHIHFYGIPQLCEWTASYEDEFRRYFPTKQPV